MSFGLTPTLQAQNHTNSADFIPQVSRTTSPCPRSMVVLEDGKIPQLLFLQEFRLHIGAVLVQHDVWIHQHCYVS